jgi:hypothetical protein
MYRLQAISWVAAAGVGSAILKHMVAVARQISGKALPQTELLSLFAMAATATDPALIFYAFEQSIKPEGIPYSDDVARGIMIEPESNMEIDLLSWTQAIYSS